MKSAILSGSTSVCVASKHWKPTLPIWSFHQLPATSFSKSLSNLKSSSSFSLLPYSCHRSAQNPQPFALGLSFTTSPTKSSIVLSECSAASWRCRTSCLMFQRSLITWSSFWNAGRHGVVNSSKAFRRASISHPVSRFEENTWSRQRHCYLFGIRKLDSTIMSGRQLRVRKEKVTTVETVLQLHTVRNGVGSTSETSQEEVEKLNKENFEVDSWQFQLLERHESNNLNSYTVAELRQLLRKMEKQPKGQKSDLLKAVKSWLHDHGCQSPSALEEESNKDLDENSLDLGIPEEVVTISKTRVAVSERIETQGGKKRTVSESSTPTNRKRRKDAGGEEIGDSVNVSAQVEKADKKSPKVKSSKKGAKEAVLKVETVTNDDKEPWTVLVHKNPKPDWLAYNPKTMRPKPLANDEKAVRLVSWNVNGLRALLKEKGVQHVQGSLIARLAAREDFDVLCLQETKLQEKDVEAIRKSLLASHEESLWSCSTGKLGYSGTAIISRIKPLSVHYGLGVPDHDKEGRLITCEFDNFYFVVSYVPNSGAKLERLVYRTQEWDVALSSYLKELEKKKPVILTGDLNCAHEDIDIHDPAGNKKSAGFTDEERGSFRKNFLDHGFVDTFRKQHPNAVAYSYWGYRTVARPKNRGWRLDYFLVSESLSEDVHDSYTIPDVGGSDHCPIGLILRT